MTCNVGTTDRIIRVIAGIIIIALGIMYRSWWGVVGIVPLATAAAGRCLLYIPFGISTCPVPSAPPSPPPPEAPTQASPPQE